MRPNVAAVITFNKES